MVAKKKTRSKPTQKIIVRSRSRKPRKDGVWCFDIGHTTFRALHCRRDEKGVPGEVVADEFANIEYPTPLNTNVPDEAKTVFDALRQFRWLHKIRVTDKVAILAPGQCGLIRFQTLPPMEAKKINLLAKFEAKQQIPFKLEECAFDWQLLPGSNDTYGMVFSPEVLISAVLLKYRRSLFEPFTKVRNAVDLVQLTPIALANYRTFDFLHRELKTTDAYSDETPPPFTVILSMGTQTTDLVITNGYRLWVRNIPLGGFHFTKVLAGGLNLTIHKAEHLKRNMKDAEDSAQVEQQLSPVIANFVSEVSRALEFFAHLNRKARIEKIIGLGNAFKTPGIDEALRSANIVLQSPVQAFRHFSGEATADPLFRENLSGFAPCYGLAVQALGWGNINTNLA